MKRSVQRILTTHTGSLPRTAKVVEFLLAEQNKPGARKAELDAAVREAIAHVVQKQNDAPGGRSGFGEPPRESAPSALSTETCSLRLSEQALRIPSLQRKGAVERHPAGQGSGSGNYARNRVSR